ncbi:HEAT repeat domain-containing protein [Ruminococcaceae bacterium OttesenSCG-928-A11]|nr:HEAT repeat domain-containing protein [Ruminococcaceae bacterium OttesenSCG-928-A11]
MTKSEKWEYLYGLESVANDTINQAQLAALQELAIDRSPLIRAEVASIAVKFINNEVLQLLLSLIRDKDELVRTEAIDSLSVFGESASYDAVSYSAKHDKYYLVRGYAVESMSMIGIKMGLAETSIESVIMGILECEKNAFVKLCCYHALFRLGKTAYFEDIVGSYTSKNYRVRCATINVLMDIVDAENVQVVKKKLATWKAGEKSNAVVGYLEKLEKIIQILTDDN